MNFTHLHVHTEYSLLDGSNKIKEYVARVKELGMDSAAITDHGVMTASLIFTARQGKRGLIPFSAARYMWHRAPGLIKIRNRGRPLLSSCSSCGKTTKVTATL